jgi:hypothetical protein
MTGNWPVAAGVPPPTFRSRHLSPEPDRIPNFGLRRRSTHHRVYQPGIDLSWGGPADLADVVLQFDGHLGNRDRERNDGL